MEKSKVLKYWMYFGVTQFVLVLGVWISPFFAIFASFFNFVGIPLVILWFTAKEEKKLQDGTFCIIKDGVIIMEGQKIKVTEKTPEKQM